MMPLTNEHQNVKVCKENYKDKYAQDKRNIKLEIIIIIQGNIKVLHMAYII